MFEWEKKTPKGKVKYGLKGTRKTLINKDFDKTFKPAMLKKPYWENLIKKKYLKETEPYAKKCNLPRRFYVCFFGMHKKDWGNTIVYPVKIRVESNGN
jgi:hypothetical protein